MYKELTSFQNLYLAYRKAGKGKRGISYVAAFEHELEENLFQLQEELLAKTYMPGKYNSFYIHEPKRRLISVAPFRDRVVHHALCNVSEGIPFLGFTVYPDRRRLKRRKGIHFQRKLRRLVNEFYDGNIPISQLNASVRGWINHVRYANSIGLRRSVLYDNIPQRRMGGDI